LLILLLMLTRGDSFSIHRGYYGCVLGDEVVCAAGEAWKVDGLWFVPGGKEEVGKLSFRFAANKGGLSHQESFKALYW